MILLQPFEGALRVGLRWHGRAFVLPDRCPHDGQPLSDGFVDGDRIVCARHGWEIDACSGRRCPITPG